MSAAALLEEMLKLPREEQIEFLDLAQEAVYEDDEEPDEDDLPQELKELLEARMTAHQADPSRVCTLEEFRSRLDERVQCLR